MLYEGENRPVGRHIHIVCRSSMPFESIQNSGNHLITYHSIEWLGTRKDKAMGKAPLWDGELDSMPKVAAYNKAREKKGKSKKGAKTAESTSESKGPSHKGEEDQAKESQEGAVSQGQRGIRVRKRRVHLGRSLAGPTGKQGYLHKSNCASVRKIMLL